MLPSNAVIGELIEHALNVAKELKLINEEGNRLAELNKIFNITNADGLIFLLVLRTAEMLDDENLVTVLVDARRRGIEFEKDVEGHVRMKPNKTFNFAGYQNFAEYRKKQMMPNVQNIKIILKDVEGWFTPATER